MTGYEDMERNAQIFNEWARRYAANPGDFDDIVGPDGRPISDYGKRAAIYFKRLHRELFLD